MTDPLCQRVIEIELHDRVILFNLILSCGSTNDLVTHHLYWFDNQSGFKNYAMNARVRF